MGWKDNLEDIGELEEKAEQVERTAERQYNRTEEEIEARKKEAQEKDIYRKAELILDTRTPLNPGLYEHDTDPLEIKRNFNEDIFIKYDGKTKYLKWEGRIIGIYLPGDWEKPFNEVAEHAEELAERERIKRQIEIAEFSMERARKRMQEWQLNQEYEENDE